jgi:hypothetical protein
LCVFAVAFCLLGCRVRADIVSDVCACALCVFCYAKTNNVTPLFQLLWDYARHCG